MEAVDRIYLERACELAARGIGNTSPNPAVGAVVVDARGVAGEGYHHRAGEPHAEVLAIAQAGDRARGATLYVSLEPCSHQGRTPPCTDAIMQAGITRVIAGAHDPNPKNHDTGIAYLREHGVDAQVLQFPRAVAAIEMFTYAIRSSLPYVALKMAMSLDGYVAAKPGRQDWLTADQALAFVRELRIAHDAVIVGAGTVRVDNPLLTVRPAHHRLRPYVRIVACKDDAVDPTSRVFAPQPGYDKTIVLAPAGAASRFAGLQNAAEVVFIGDDGDRQLDMATALRELKQRGISSVLCEGGPTMAAGLLADGHVNRCYWLIAPTFLRGEGAVPVLAARAGAHWPGLRIDRVETLGPDVLVTGSIERDV